MRLAARLSSFRSLTFLLAAAALVASAPATRADDEVVLAPRPIDRRFPQGQFCSLPVDLEFTAPGPTVRVVFEAKRFVLDPGDQQLHWTEQYIDNVAIAGAAAYDAHFAPPPSGSSSEFCYLDFPVSMFYFNSAGLVLPLLELFDTNPAARGWDLAHGAYFRGDRSGPRHPESASTPDLTGGSLGLGEDSPAPVGNEVATTEIVVNGLTQGQNYNLSAWWDVNHPIFNDTEAFLTISIFGPGSTPVVVKSWGAVKRSYR